MLEVRDLKVRYGGIAAVKGIGFEVTAGEMVCLIGANGAGKTTTLKALARLVRSEGSVRFDGRDIGGWPAHRMIGEGMTLVPEGRGVFARLTVAENLAMGAYSRRDTGAIASDLARVYGLLPRLKERAGQLAGTLSGGEQQMLAIGRALMSKPKLLLLDEPSMGLAPLMVQKVFEVIRAVAAQGVTILLVEQNAKLALEAASRGYVIESGAITLAADAQSLLQDPKVREAYLGE
ncbi:MAG: ABC transporter ATP-binding protein [Betaproteobacteria bacterium CG2_30_68_42]|nr:MAG: ABC transporter ATP-binding protein [Betaproteobacteria bacterium CG2_30_68_42]PIX75182.1 MAG: ABC transporter ATP-binding protein [Rhodocyclales bacterium CG_4_10_14_3_um_filter_68_10]PJA56316.1 MAG: ABC transporter ATP-binding protein [Rhodocyclales bacterium CG_4_9_14_3_um_filter_68_10]